MAHSQFKKYQIFEGEVSAPFEYIRTLSNGVNIGAFIVEDNDYDGDFLTIEDLDNYIKQNHIEPDLEI